MSEGLARDHHQTRKRPAQNYDCANDCSNKPGLFARLIPAERLAPRYVANKAPTIPSAVVKINPLAQTQLRIFVCIAAILVTIE
jgi:hypothetical protein